MNEFITLLNLIFDSVAQRLFEWPPPTQTVAPQTIDLGGFSWPAAATVCGALVAASAVVLTLLANAARARREALATLYAGALGYVAEYLEGPYRILRKDGTAATRFAITSKLSDVKASIDHSQALLRLHAPSEIADAYDDYVHAAQTDAGKQMHEAWNAAPVESDEAVNLFDPLPRGGSSASRVRLVEIMQADLELRWFRRETRRRYTRSVQDCQVARNVQRVDEEGTS